MKLVLLEELRNGLIGLLYLRPSFYLTFWDLKSVDGFVLLMGEDVDER